MRTRTCLSLLLVGLLLATVASGILAPSSWPGILLRRCWQGVGAALRALVDPAEGGTAWRPATGDPGAIEVTIGDEVRRVRLPEGIEAGDVRRVEVTAGGSVVVEVLP